MINLLAFLFFSALPLAFIPRLLPVFSTTIPGGLEDTRLFLWNAWWFRQAIDVLHQSPFQTSMLFYPTGASLVVHDYPLWTNLVTYLAQSAGLNVVAASNVWFLLSWGLAGFCSYLLVREITRARGPAFVSGLYVMTHSYLLARGMQNWGYMNLFGLPLFLWALCRAHRTGKPRDYVLSGLLLAWTAACQYYYLIYAGVIWLVWLMADVLPWRIAFERRQTRPEARYIFLGIAAAAGIVAGWIVFGHPAPFHLGRKVVTLGTPANALLVMWLGLFGWAHSWFRGTITFAGAGLDSPQTRERLKQGAIVLATALVCLSPLIWGVLKLTLGGGYPRQSILWKTHLSGANLLSFFMPNPIHAIWGERISRFFWARGMHPHEEAASLGWVCLALIGWSQLWRAPEARRWVRLAAASVILSMGIYLHILQHNLWMPLPFYVWRLLPVLGNVRVPERFMAVGSVALAVLLAMAIIRLAKQKGWRLTALCWIAGAAIVFENLPGIPLGRPPENLAVYQTLKALPRGGVLTLPFGIRDSAISAGASSSMQWAIPWDDLGVQVHHQQPIIGGCIGRLSRRQIDRYKSDPFFRQLLDLEEGKPVPVKIMPVTEACRSMKEFDVSYVLMVQGALAPLAFNFAHQSLPLRSIARSEGVELFQLNCQ